VIEWSMIAPAEQSQGLFESRRVMVHLNSKPDRMLQSKRRSTGSRSSRAFTLVELLVVITILAILSSIVLFALASVQESARDMKTRATIEKIDALLMQKYETYRTRRLPIMIFTDENGSDLNGNGNSTDHYSTQQIAKYRLDTLRDFMRLELPERFTDIDDPPVAPKVIGGTTKISRPSVSAVYQKAIASAKRDHESSKCLYLIVTKGLGDPDVLEQFAPNEIGDVDNDGMYEFLDGWGRPIAFLRWAPAFHSPLQPTSPTEHDPFDPMNSDSTSNTFPLHPLIYSAGPDKKFDILTEPSTTGGGGVFHYSTQSSPNNPFVAPARDQIGSFFDSDSDGDDSIDNITNHDLSGS
jgi:prepilin-type N-terminal cleavage/methylation domain-containing protein